MVIYYYIHEGVLNPYGTYSLGKWKAFRLDTRNWITFLVPYQYQGTFPEGV